MVFVIAICVTVIKAASSCHTKNKTWVWITKKKSFASIWIQMKTFLKGVLEKWHFPCSVIKTSVLINLWNYPARRFGRVWEKIRENNKDACWSLCSSLNSEWPFRSVLGERTRQFEMKDNANMGKRLKKKRFLWLWSGDGGGVRENNLEI